MRSILAVCCTLLMFGCSVKTVPITENEGFPLSDEMEAAVYFIGDNQFHIPYGNGYRIENAIINNFSNVAVRPPRTTIFAPYAFEALLRELNQSSLLIHLGDAADVSCPQELSRFFKSMEQFNGPWLFVPGNHDGFYTGNTQYKKNNKDPHEWDYACGNEERLDKAGVIEAYVKAKNLCQGEVIKDEIIDSHWVEKGLYVECSYKITSDPDMAHQSFIIQKVLIDNGNGSPVKFVILDTAQYEKAPKYRNVLFFNDRKVAGITGQMLANQMHIAEEWFAESRNKGELLFVAGHHPLKKNCLSKEGLAWYGGSKWIKKMMKKYDITGYVSAHTHIGGTRELWGGKREWNIASLVDWPLGMRAMVLEDQKPVMKEILFDSHLTPWQKCCDCSNAFYRSFHEKEKAVRPDLSGRTVQYSLLVSEIKILVEVFEQFFLEETRKEIYEAKIRLDVSEKRVGEKTPVQILDDEIIELGTLVRSQIIHLDKLLGYAGPDLQKRFDHYAWCRLWQSAREDAMRNWDKEGVLGQRKKWD